MVVVTMADDDVLDRSGIKPHLLQAVRHFVLDRVVEDRVEDDDAVRGRERPRGVLRLSDKVQVVEDLDRFGVPLREVASMLTVHKLRGRLRGSRGRRCAYALEVRN